MGSKTFRTGGDFMRFGTNIHVACHCGHKGVVHRVPAHWHFQTRRLPSSVDVMKRYFKCSACGQRGRIRFGPTDQPPTFPQWGIQSQEDLQRAVKRLRG